MQIAPVMWADVPKGPFAKTTKIMFSYRHEYIGKPIIHEKCCSGNQRGRDHLGELDKIRRIILKSI
jgi:hypothetical protein